MFFVRWLIYNHYKLTQMCKIITKNLHCITQMCYICSIIIKQIDIMKTLINKIDRLTEEIEMGFYTKKEAMFKLRELRSEVADKFEEGSDEFMQCIECLIDANSITDEL